MKLCRITYTEAVRRHPSEVGAALAHLRKGRSQERHRPPHELEWSYETAVWVHARPDPKQPLVDRVHDEEQRTTVSLHAQKGRWSWATSLNQHPPELLPAIRERLSAPHDPRPLPHPERSTSPARAWRRCPRDSRTAVLAELTQMLKGWESSAHDLKTRTDVETLRRLIALATTPSP